MGATLRAARTARGISLAELQAHTKISARHLAAFEEERFDLLPPLPFARGFLRTVAAELGLDPGPLVARLNAAMAEPQTGKTDDLRRLESALVPAVPPSRYRRVAITAGIAAALVVTAIVVFFAAQLRDLARPVPEVAPRVEATPPGGPGAPGASPADRAVQPSPAATPRPEGGVTVEVQATGRSWLLVQTGTGALFEGFIHAGQAMRWQSREAISLRVGNAGAVVVVVDGTALGPLGRPGEVVTRTFQARAAP